MRILPRRSPGGASQPGQATYLRMLGVLATSVVGCLGGGAPVAWAQTLPATDQRAAVVRDVNTPRSFPAVSSRAGWESLAARIRHQVLVSCGLWPLPEKAPLKAHVFGRLERDGYSVEKVYLETYPGFYLGGNLYRPLGRGTGPFPAMLNPHGHWKTGRLAEEERGSVPARCIHFARQGIIAFAYDMAGYNDTMQLGVHRKFFLRPELQLWNINLMGLQTWNSIRALDFLESLPDVDKRRIACTGASGGGTQTFMLGAVDDRLVAQAPIVMVSHSMQGGCQCENAPGLRVEHSNMEIAALPAPRPQLLVAATGDWTRMTMTVEGPAIAGVYGLLNKPREFAYRIYDFPHNYNQTTREAVYAWVNQQLLGDRDPAGARERPYPREADSDLRVWPDGRMPADALNESAFIQFLIRQAAEQHRALLPRDRRSLERYKEMLTPAWRHNLQLELPAERDLAIEQRVIDQTTAELAFGRKGRGDRVPATLHVPARSRSSACVILVHPQGRGGHVGGGLVDQLVNRGYAVLLVDLFLTGAARDEERAAARKPFEKYFTTYNRTDVQERVQDLLTASAVVRSVVANCAQFDATGDATFLEPDVFTPGLRKLGGFEGVALLAAPRPLLLHNHGERFPLEALHAAYSGLRAGGLLRTERPPLGSEDILDWLAQSLRR
jgi:dienelactone hydrolase